MIEYNLIDSLIFGVVRHLECLLDKFVLVFGTLSALIFRRWALLDVERSPKGRHGCHNLAPIGIDSVSMIIGGRDPGYSTEYARGGDTQSTLYISHLL